uniref:Uncharacterized protein n=1 Tax=Schlesneria paludicola TaxID=360056 RepID=A0A7C2NZD1_9PLAN
MFDSELPPPIDRTRWRDIAKEVLATGATARYEFPVLHTFRSTLGSELLLIPVLVCRRFNEVIEITAGARIAMRMAGTEIEGACLVDDDELRMLIRWSSEPDGECTNQARPTLARYATLTGLVVEFRSIWQQSVAEIQVPHGRLVRLTLAEWKRFREGLRKCVQFWHDTA